MTIDELSNKVIGIAIDIHKALGPGLLENVYQECLFHELQMNGIYAEKEKPLPVIFKKIKIDCGYRLDLLVDKRLVIEIKSISALKDIHTSQLLTYLRLGKYKLGLLINFNVQYLGNGIKRVINGFEEKQK